VYAQVEEQNRDRSETGVILLFPIRRIGIWGVLCQGITGHELTGV
jgi:hypothetical protein